MSDAKIQIANTTDVLEGTKVTTLAGDNLFREGVVVSDPIVGEARARCLNTEPASNEYGMSVRQVGPVGLDAATLAALETVNVGNAVAVTGPLTNAELRASPINVAGTIDANDIITQDQPTLVTREIDMETQIAHGLLDGFSIVNKFGYNPDIDTATVPEDVWGGSGVYTGFPATALETLTVVSTSANDTLAGTGAQRIRVIGLDANYNVLQEDINLNGLAGGVSVGQFRRVHTAFVIQAGSGQVNAGTITVRHTTTAANVFLVMDIGRNQTNSSAYTIPDGFTGYMRRLMLSARVVSSLGAGGLMQGGIWTKQNGFPFRLRRPFLLAGNSEYTDEIYGGLAFPSRSDLIIRVTSVSDNNGQITTAYDLLLVRNPV